MPFPFQATLRPLIEPLRLAISRGLMAAGIYYAFPVDEDETFPGHVDRALFSSVLIGVGLLVSPDAHVPARMRVNPQAPRTLLGGMWHDATTGPENRAWTLGHVVASFSIVHAMRPVLGELPTYRFLGSGMNLLTYGVFRVSGHRRYLSHFTDLRGREFSLSWREIRHWMLNFLVVLLAELAVLAMQFSNTTMLQIRFQPGQGIDFGRRHGGQLRDILGIHLLNQIFRQMAYAFLAATPDCTESHYIRWATEAIAAWVRAGALGSWNYLPITLVEAVTTDRWHLQDELAYLRGIPLISQGHFRTLQSLDTGGVGIVVVPGQVVTAQVDLGIPVSHMVARNLAQVPEAPGPSPLPVSMAPVIAPRGAGPAVVTIHIGHGDFKRARATPPFPGQVLRRPPSPSQASAPFAPGSLPLAGLPSHL